LAAVNDRTLDASRIIVALLEGATTRGLQPGSRAGSPHPPRRLEIEWSHVAADLGIGAETLRKQVRQAEADSGRRTDLLTSAEREEIRKLRRENFELR
jgi:transposase-like protein